ncbi:ribonuclease H-like domain-containing protein [Tanacetum coccineum]
MAQTQVDSTTSVPTGTQTQTTSQPVTSNPPTRAHLMVTRTKDGTCKITQRLNLYVSHISPVPKSPSLALSNPHWRNAMYDEYNALIKKARLVVNGRSKQIGIDCDETFSPVVKPATIRTILSLALTRHWLIHQLDVKNAFLNGDLSERDYIVLTASLTALLQKIIFSLHMEFDMTDLGALNHFLWIFVTRDTTGMLLSQKRYAMELLERAHMLNCNPTQTPVYTESKLGPEGTPIPDPTLYRSLAGNLQYLTFTRPNLSYVVQQICLYMHDPRDPHLAALKKILCYVLGTLEFGLQLHASSESSLVAYPDADWDGCPVTRRSTSGYYFWVTIFYHGLLSDNPLFHVQVLKLFWYQSGVKGVALNVMLLMVLVLLFYSANPVQHQRTKHIEVDIHFVRHMVAMGHVRVLYVPSRYKYADIFTKGLPSTSVGSGSLYGDVCYSGLVWRAESRELRGVGGAAAGCLARLDALAAWAQLNIQRGGFQEAKQHLRWQLSLCSGLECCCIFSPQSKGCAMAVRRAGRAGRLLLGAVRALWLSGLRGHNILSWSSKRQPTLSRSSAEAEYRGVANVVAETAWLRNLLRELHTPLLTVTLVYCDNVSVVYLSANPVQHQRTKHIEIDIHFVRHMVAMGHVRVLHVPSRYKYADIFTKGLPSTLFEEFRTSLSV